MNTDWSNKDVMMYLGASNLSETEREEHDFYATPPLATQWLCRLETFDHEIWEPACGLGHISEELRKSGHRVRSSDLIGRGYGLVQDFLSLENQEWHGDIVTNPPYKYAQEFVEKALAIIPDGNKVAMFLKLTFLEGKSRRELFRIAPPSPCGCHRPAWPVRQMATSLE